MAGPPAGRRGRGRASSLGLVAISLGAITAVHGCGNGDPYLTVRDPDGDPVSTGVVTMYHGPHHCGWGDVTFLHLGWPVGHEIARDARMYVRDPDGILAGRTVATYVDDAPLPQKARFTGYTSDVGQVWLADDEEVAYLVSDEDGKQVEAWPRTKTVLGCD